MSPSPTTAKVTVLPTAGPKQMLAWQPVDPRGELREWQSRPKGARLLP